MFHRMPYTIFFIWANYGKNITPEQAVQIYEKIQSGTLVLQCENKGRRQFRTKKQLQNNINFL